MNVLLISFSFPPAGGVGVLRALSLAKYLPENDVRVDVLTARNAPAVGKDLTLLQQVPESVTVHRTWTLDLPFEQRKMLKKLISGGRTKKPAATSNAAQQNSGNPIKNMIADLLLPDPQVGWLPFAFPAARRVIRERKIDLVLITVPPYSSVYLVKKLRKVFPALPIVVDFRDEWLTTTINLVSFNSNERARRVAVAAEAECVQHASAIVAVTDAARLEIMSRYPNEAAEKFQYIPNGFDTMPAAMQGASETPATMQPTDDRVVLTFIGSVYRSTDPATLIEAALGLPEALRARLRLRFIGHVEAEEDREALLRLGESVELKGFVPQAEALRSIADSDYLLLISHDRINVSAKFYDYLGGGKPVLAIIHPHGDIRKLLDETKAGIWADSKDVASIRDLLASILDPERRRTMAQVSPDQERIASYHRKAITQRYAALLHEITEQRAHRENGGQGY